MVAKLDSKRVNGKASCQPIQEELNDNPYNSFYNLQKKAYDDLKYDTDPSTSQFVSAVEFGIYALLSLPFLLLLIPYWIFAIIVTWFAKHWIIATIIIVILLIYLSFMSEINQLIARFI